MTNSCLSLDKGSARTSGKVLWTWLFFCDAVPLRWQSKPMFPGSWNLWSWGPNGPIVSSGQTVREPEEEQQKEQFSPYNLSALDWKNVKECCSSNKVFCFFYLNNRSLKFALPAEYVSWFHVISETLVEATSCQLIVNSVIREQIQ